MPGQQRRIDIVLYNVSLNCNLPGKPSLFAVADKKTRKCLEMLAHPLSAGARESAVYAVTPRCMT